MQTHLALLFILHVLGIAVLMGKLSLASRPLGILATALYFFFFYLGLGIWLSRDPNWLVPEVSLKNDYFSPPPKKSSTFFQDLGPGDGNKDKDQDRDRNKDDETDQVNTTP